MDISKPQRTAPTEGSGMYVYSEKGARVLLDSSYDDGKLMSLTVSR